MEQVKIIKLEEGKTFSLVGDFNRETKKKANDELYEFVKISDNTGTAFARVWNNLSIYPSVLGIEDGAYCEAIVKCTEYGQYINIEVLNIREIERPLVTYVDIQGLTDELRFVLKNFQDAKLKALVTSVFNRQDVRESFFTAPASQQHGYSFDGGLLAHTVRTVRLAVNVANTVNSWNHNVDGVVSKLNIDLLVTACMLHDIGKVRAFKKNKNRVEKTMEGELFEDSYLSMRIVLEELSKVDLSEHQRSLLEHVLGASKGQQGFGALFIPRSIEAMAFHLIELLDVNLAHFEHLKREATPEDEFVKLFQKTVFLGGYSEQ